MNQPYGEAQSEAHGEHPMRQPAPDSTGRPSEPEFSAPASEREPGAREGEREPIGRPADAPQASPSRPETTGGGDVAWHEAEGYRQRFMQVQAEFIDDPRAAVEHAGSLVKEAVDRLVDSARHQSNGGGEADTERLRVTLQRYRDLMENVAGRSR